MKNRRKEMKIHRMIATFLLLIILVATITSCSKPTAAEITNFKYDTSKRAVTAIYLETDSGKEISVSLFNYGDTFTVELTDSNGESDVSVVMGKNGWEFQYGAIANVKYEDGKEISFEIGEKIDVIKVKGEWEFAELISEEN